MKPAPPDEFEDTSGPDPTRIWTAYGVSAAAALHVVVAALVLINRSH